MSVQSASFPVSILLACLLLGACAGRPPPSGEPVSPDLNLIMGEIALLRDMPQLAVEQYLQAALLRDEAGIARRGLMIAIHADDMDSARILADRWEMLAPQDSELVQYQAILKFRAGDTEGAYDYLLRGTADETAAAIGARLQMITGLLAGERNVWRAADLMARLAMAHPEVAEGWHGAGLLALEADRPGQAVGFARRAVALQPDMRDAVFLQARAALTADPGAGRHASDAILAPLKYFRNDADPGLRYRYAGLLVMAGRPGDADALFQDILVNDPDQHDARMARALLALEQGRDATAEEELRALLARHGRVPDALYFLGMIAEDHGELASAAVLYGRVAPDISNPERWLEAQQAQARILLRTEGLEAALQYFDELREQWPDSGHELVLREAALLMGAGQPRLALARLDALAEEPGIRRGPDLDWQIAVAAAEAGQTARAEAVFRGMLRADPGNPVLMNALAWLLLEQTRRHGEAATLLEQALEIAPANPAILASAGRLKFVEGDLDAARGLLEESWRREPAAATGRRLYELLDALGDRAARDRHAQDLQRRYPDMNLEQES